MNSEQKEIVWFRLKLILFILVMFGISIGVYYAIKK